MVPTLGLEPAEYSQESPDRLPDHDYEDVLVAGQDLEASRLSEYGD